MSEKKSQSDLLKEAIADARKVKETAIANAKLALEESITPFLKEKLSAKLAEIESSEYDDINLDEIEEDTNEIEIEESIEEVEETYEDEDGDDEFNLDELLAELEEESTLNENEEETETEEEDDDFDIEDMSEEDLTKFIENVISDMVENGELEPTESEDEELDIDVEDDTEHINEIMLGASDSEAILSLLAGILGLPLTAITSLYAKKGINAVKKLVSNKKDGKNIKADLNESLKTINTLKTTLKEVNLLNSKLLYTNKLLMNKKIELNENVVVKTLSLFDKATTLKEVELIYESVLTQNKKPISKMKRTSIKESMFGGGSKKSTSPTKEIIPTDESFTRMQKLAGLI